MPVSETGPGAEAILAGIEEAPSLLDQAAQAHAEAIVAQAERLGYVHHPQRTITRDGEGVRTITDRGVSMRWLLGRKVPIRGATETVGGKARQVVRTVTAASLARGGWHYPGMRRWLEEADNSSEVRAVVEEWQRRLVAGDGA